MQQNLKTILSYFPDSKYIIWNRKKYLNKNKKDKGKMCKQNFSYNSKDNKKRLNISDLKKYFRKTSLVIKINYNRHFIDEKDINSVVSSLKVTT